MYFSLSFLISGERIAIQGLTPEQFKPGSTVQLQVKGGGTQTLQLHNIASQGLTGKLFQISFQKLSLFRLEKLVENTIKSSS